jgi:hypothetical protein
LGVGVRVTAQKFSDWNIIEGSWRVSGSVYSSMFGLIVEDIARLIAAVFSGIAVTLIIDVIVFVGLCVSVSSG